MFTKIFSKNIILSLPIIFGSLCILISYPHKTYADDVDSTNYKIENLTFGSGGGDTLAKPVGPTGCLSSEIVAINNSSLAQTLTNYQVQLDINYLAGMQSDFSDIRFTNNSGSDLDYWIETYVASTSATLWVEVDSIPESSVIYVYMWYNSCTGGNNSNASDTFVWYDDFSSDTSSNYGYSEDPTLDSGCPGSISWDSGYEALNVDAPENCGVFATPSGISLQNVHIDITIRSNTSYDGDGQIAINTRHQDNSNYYQFSYANATYTSPWLRVVEAGVKTPITNGSEFILLNTWYDLEVVNWGTNLEMWVAETSKLSATDSTFTSAENVALSSIEMDSYFDNLIVRNYYEPEPTASIESYGLLTSFGGNLNDDRFSSPNYSLGIGVVETWLANTPTIKCFETTTNGSTNCDDADITPNGMVQVCGGGGCFNKARVELTAENNPSDTLYSIQITTDSGWNTWDYVDGSTFYIESESNHDIDDYLLESTWEGTASSFNIFGLEPSTTYYVRATALNGDFTESLTGPSVSATSGTTSITFDLDIADTAGNNAETAAPYSIDLGQLTVGSIKTGSNLIWFDLNSNASGGSVVLVKDSYTGLYSPSSGYTITSADADLDSVAEGFGLQEYTSSETYLGPLAVATDFGNGGSIVGGIATTAVTIYNTSSNPISGGRGSVFIKTRADSTTPTATDYEDEITLIVVGTY